MGYYLNAIIGDREVLLSAAKAMSNATVVNLSGKLAMILMTEELVDELNQGEGDYDDASPFTYLSGKITAKLRSLSTNNTIAYVEAEYFGGTGCQCAVCWQNGLEVFPPAKKENAINQVLKTLGVMPAREEENALIRLLKTLGVIRARVKDEFDTVGLGRHRHMEVWLEERIS